MNAITVAFAFTVFAGCVLFGVLGILFPAPAVVKPEPRRPIVGALAEDDIERSRR